MSTKSLIDNVMAGLTISFAALSLGAAFGELSGRGAFAGMLSAGIIPIITSLFGGTRIQASGPTAPMTAVTAVVVAHAYDSYSGQTVLAEQFISLVLLLSSALIVIAGLLRLGRFIRYVPNVVMLGFMNGIACLIWKDQIAYLFGFGQRGQIGGNSGVNFLIVVGILLSIYLLPKLYHWLNLNKLVRSLFPPMFVSIVLFFMITLSVDVERVAMKNADISGAEYFSMLVNFFPSDPEILSFGGLVTALPYALQLCLLAYLDSLLTSMVVDHITHEKTNRNKELIAQGFANACVSLLQAIPGAQATIRSVLLVKEGASSRFAGVFVGIFVLFGLFIFSQWVSLLASAILIGILIKAGWDVFDRDFFRVYYRQNGLLDLHRNLQLLVIVYTTLMTVFVNLNVAVISATIIYHLLKKFIHLTDVQTSMIDH